MISPRLIPHTQHLSFHSCQNFTDSHLIEFSQQFVQPPQILRQVDFFNTSISHKGLLFFLNKISGLSPETIYDESLPNFHRHWKQNFAALNPDVEHKAKPDLQNKNNNMDRIHHCTLPDKEAFSNHSHSANKINALEGQEDRSKQKEEKEEKQFPVSISKKKIKAKWKSQLLSLETEKRADLPNNSLTSLNIGQTSITSYHFLDISYFLKNVIDLNLTNLCKKEPVGLVALAYRLNLKSLTLFNNWSFHE